MTIEPLNWLPALIAIIGGVAWLIRLEGRVNTAEVLAGVSNSAQSKNSAEMVKHLERTEGKLDSLILLLAQHGVSIAIKASKTD